MYEYTCKYSLQPHPPKRQGVILRGGGVHDSMLYVSMEPVLTTIFQSTMTTVLHNAVY